MLVPFLVMLREGVEAALIVGIVAGYLCQTGRGAWVPVVWVGVLLALALSLFVGAGLQFANAEFPQKIQEGVEAVIGLLAVAVLTYMVFWMRNMSRSIKGELHASIDAAFRKSHGQGLALAGVAFLAVAREGLEAVFFLLATVDQGAGALAPLGALLGLLVAVAIGYGIYAGAVRLNLARFFRWTSILILVVAAGLLAGSIRALHEAGLWNHLQATAFDLSDVLPGDSPVGTIISGLFGYQDSPSWSSAIAYAAFLLITLSCYLTLPISATTALKARRT
jgi:high-affinity iron transporter